MSMCSLAQAYGMESFGFYGNIASKEAYRQEFVNSFSNSSVHHFPNQMIN